LKKILLNIASKIGLFGYFFSVLFKHIKINKKAKKLGYYTSIADIPMYNWDKIEQGEFKYLFKKGSGVIPEYFPSIIQDMFFQFEKINIDSIEKKHKLAYLKNLYVTTKRTDFLNKHNHLKAEIEKEEKREIKKTTLNEKVNYIESVFNSIGNIDVKKMSAGRFYSLLDLAIKKAETNGTNS
jgi:hypothetical protein